MKFRIVIAAAVLAMSANASQAAITLAKPTAAKGVQCGASYIAAGKTCAKAPAAATGKGVKCGDSYIAAGQVCHKTTTMAPAKTAMTSAKPAMASSMTAKGKKCGNSYIAANATCTKK